MSRPAYPGAPRFLLDENNAGGAGGGGEAGAGGNGAGSGAGDAGGAAGGGAGDQANAGAAGGSAGDGQSGGGGGDPSPYRPDGLPDHLFGANDRETLDKIFGAYKGARQSIGEGNAVPDKPEGYSFEASDKLKPYVENFDKDPVYGKVREIAHKAGISDKQFKAFLPGVLEHFVDGELVAAPVDPKALLRDMAPASMSAASEAERETAGARRVQDNIAWVDGAKTNGAMPEGVADFFAASAAGDPRAHAAIEWLRGANVEPAPALGGSGGGGGASEDALKARIADPRGQVGGPQYDAAFAAETDRLYQQTYR